MAIIDTLRKLIEHSKSAQAIGNVREAEAFAAKVQELLLRHKLDMTEVELSQVEKDEPPIKEVLNHVDLGTTLRDGDASWTGVLLNAVVQANFCRAVRIPRQRVFGLSLAPGYFVVVGRRSDCDAAKLLFTYLYESACDAARNEAATFDFMDYLGTRAAFISAFKVGFAQAIYHRLERQRAKLRAGASEQALVRIGQMERRVEEKFRELYPDVREGRRGRVGDWDGYEAGSRYGTAIGINSTKRLKEA